MATIWFQKASSVLLQETLKSDSLKSSDQEAKIGYESPCTNASIEILCNRHILGAILL
jgi:hypothetical protein